LPYVVKCPSMERKIGRCRGDRSSAQVGTRPIYLDDPAHQVDCAIYRRERLAPGVRVSGPCVIEEYASTTVLFEGDTAETADTGELIIEVSGT